MTVELQPDETAAGIDAHPVHEKDTPRQRLLRLGFLALLAGGLVLWTQLRKPRELIIELDLAAAMPGELSEVDLLITREGHLLSRKVLNFDVSGAPQILRSELRAKPGAAELEADLIYRSGPTRRTRAQIELSVSAPARVAAERVE